MTKTEREIISRHMAELGAVGGRKSRRQLTREQAQAIRAVREEKRKAKNKRLASRVRRSSSVRRAEIA